jgi:hypothetical protein
MQGVRNLIRMQLRSYRCSLQCSSRPCSALLTGSVNYATTDTLSNLEHIGIFNDPFQTLKITGTAQVVPIAKLPSIPQGAMLGIFAAHSSRMRRRFEYLS